jgi:1-acyl-sn-glycerol-3-phosphate acyltransferase
MKLFYRFCRFGFRLYLRIFYRLQVHGIEHIVPGRGIIASNHTSFLDPPVIGACWPEEIFFLARKSLFTPPLFGTLIRHLNAFPVTGTLQDISSIKLVCKLLEEERKVLIFPEGIRSSDGELAPLKTGIGMIALRCGAPIIPVYLQGCYEIWNRWKRFPKLWGKITCVIGSPIYPHTFAHLEKKQAQHALSQQLRDSLEALQQKTRN